MPDVDAKSAPAASPSPGELVLVVDDDEAVLELANEFLRRAGYRAQGAAGGVEAVDSPIKSGRILCAISGDARPALRRRRESTPADLRPAWRSGATQAPRISSGAQGHRWRACQRTLSQVQGPLV